MYIQPKLRKVRMTRGNDARTIWNMEYLRRKTTTNETINDIIKENDRLISDSKEMTIVIYKYFVNVAEQLKERAEHLTGNSKKWILLGKMLETL